MAYNLNNLNYKTELCKSYQVTIIYIYLQYITIIYIIYQATLMCKYGWYKIVKYSKVKQIQIWPKLPICSWGTWTSKKTIRYHEYGNGSHEYGGYGRNGYNVSNNNAWSTDNDVSKSKWFFWCFCCITSPPSHTSSVPVADLSQDLCGSLNQNNIFK